MNEEEYYCDEIFPLLPCHWPVQFVCPVSSRVLTPIWMEYLMNIKIRFRSPRTNMASIAYQIRQDRNNQEKQKNKKYFWIFKLLIKKTLNSVIGFDSWLIIGFENENKCFPVSITIINACWKEPGYYKCFLIKSRMLMTFWRLYYNIKARVLEH